MDGWMDWMDGWTDRWMDVPPFIILIIKGKENERIVANQKDHLGQVGVVPDVKGNDLYVFNCKRASPSQTHTLKKEMESPSQTQS